MAEQLVFDMPVLASRDGHDFLIAEANRNAVTLLGRPDIWQNHCCLICGPEKSGKSHLAGAWARYEGAEVIQCAELAANREADGVFRSDVSALCIEDIHAVAGRPEIDLALMHAMNFLAGRHATLLMTARGLPPDWHPLSPELSTRLAAISQAVITDPDDELLHGLLAKSIADRQLICPPNVLEYLVRRIERSFVAAEQVVEALDHASLKRRRPITRKLAGAVLDQGEFAQNVSKKPDI